MRIALLLAGAIAGAAVAQPRAKETVISDPTAAGWSFDGGPKVKQLKADAIPGGTALLVTVAQKPAKPWDIQARMPLKAGVAVGDTVTFGFYARADKPDPGRDTATVTVRVQRGGAPYDAALEGAIAVGKDWTFHCLAGAAKTALSPAEAQVSVQMGGEKHAVAVGTWMVTKIAGGGDAAKSALPCVKAAGAT